MQTKVQSRWNHVAFEPSNAFLTPKEIDGHDYVSQWHHCPQIRMKWCWDGAHLLLDIPKLVRKSCSVWMMAWHGWSPSILGHNEGHHFLAILLVANHNKLDICFWCCSLKDKRCASRLILHYLLSSSFRSNMLFNLPAVTTLSRPLGFSPCSLSML